MRHMFFYSLIILVGCAAEVAQPKDGAIPEIAFHDGDDAPADAYSRRLDFAGSLSYGASVERSYSESGYTGYSFVGHEGARVSLELRGLGNDPVLTVYGPKHGTTWRGVRRIGENDDYRGRLDSYLDLRLPRDGTYLVIAREYYGNPGSFSLTLGCGTDECRLECGAGECPSGATCHRIVCVRAPCPSYCEASDAPTTTGACGSRGLPACGEGEFCNYPESAGCGETDAPGVCAPRPDACIRIFRPVCGCDGRTYGNDCDAHAAGVSVRSEGECPGTGECAAAECGPALGMPTVLCSDGTTGGPTGRCLRHDDGTCGWEVRECPLPECITGGCSRQVCAEAGGPPIITTCEWRSEYECLRQSRCERQPDGACGWTPTAEYRMCMDALARDCRSTGCAAGRYCSFCWGSYACIPEGAVC